MAGHETLNFVGAGSIPAAPAMTKSQHMNISWARGPYQRMPSDVPDPPRPPDDRASPESDEPKWVHEAYERDQREREERYQRELQIYNERMKKI